MNELERLQRENRHLRKRIQELEKTIAVITSMNRSPIGADINRSIEISRVLEQQESALLIAELINTVSDKTKMNLKQQQEKKKMLLAEKAAIDAKISKDIEKIAEVPAIKREILIEQLGRVLGAIYTKQVYGFLYAMNNVYKMQRDLM
jgi:cell division septum initiation protein DivIVA